MATTGNGGGTSELTTLQREVIQVLGSVIADRSQFAARLGLQYNGVRDVYAALGWPKSLSWLDYYGKYRRQDLATRIVDLPADATWRDGFEIHDNPEPDIYSPFEKAWVGLEKDLGLISWLHRLDRMAGIGEYAVLFLGVRGQPADQPLRRAKPGDLMYVSLFPQPRADIKLLVEDEMSPRFGLPEYYNLEVVNVVTTGSSAMTTIGLDRVTGRGRQVRAHWSRVIHCAEISEDSRILGRPRLENVYNLLELLMLVIGGAGEGYWRSGHPRLHANIAPEYSGVLTGDQLDALGDEISKMLHGFQDWVRTSGTDIQQLSGGIADPRQAVEPLVDLIGAARGIPKRILLGSERGELASSQDAQEWAHRVAERQKNFAEPVVIRPMIDRLMETGVLPPAQGGDDHDDYEVRWPDLTGPNAEQRAQLAERYANTEARHANAELTGGVLFTRNELREALGFEPIEDIEEEYPGELAEVAKEEARAEQEAQAEADAERAAEQQGGAAAGEPGAGAEERPEAAAGGLRELYDPDQPRDPAGTDTGGQWTKGGAATTPADVKTKGALEDFATPPEYDDGTHHYYTHAVRTDDQLEQIRTEGLKPNQAGDVYASASPLVRDRGGGYAIFRVAKDSDDAIEGIDVVEEGLSYKEYRFERAIKLSELHRIVPVVTDKTGFRIRSDELARAFLGGRVSADEVADLPLPYAGWADLTGPEAAAGVKAHYDPDQPRVPKGEGDESGEWTSEGGGGARSITAVEERAFNGQRIETETTLSKQEAGALGERVVIAYLQEERGFKDASALNMERSNFPVDLVQDHELIEVKTGMVSNGPSAQHWRATIGQPGKAEREWLATATAVEKRAWNQRKSAAILERKGKVLADWSRRHGIEAKGRTITTIINPDTKTVDLYEFSGFHLRIKWNSPEAEKAYVGSYRYE